MLAVSAALLYPAPSYAHAAQLHDTKAGGPHFVRVKAGTPVLVLGLMKPGNRPCPECVTYAVVQLPNGNVVALGYKDINYQTQTVRVDTNAFGPYTSEDLKEFRWLPGTGGAALLPLVGAVMLLGGGLLLPQLPH
jgi:hypothetical protein